jgi:hypothetical protein
MCCGVLGGEKENYGQAVGMEPQQAEEKERRLQRWTSIKSQHTTPLFYVLQPTSTLSSCAMDAVIIEKNALRERFRAIRKNTKICLKLP